MVVAGGDTLWGKIGQGKENVSIILMNPIDPVVGINRFSCFQLVNKMKRLCQ